MPITDGGKIVAVIAALSGTVILALPIAVVGVTFDDEWVKQAKTNRFASESCVFEYNAVTRSGTRHVNMKALKETSFQKFSASTRVLVSRTIGTGLKPKSSSIHPDMPLQQHLISSANMLQCNIASPIAGGGGVEMTSSTSSAAA